VAGYGAKPGAGWTKTGSVGDAAGLMLNDSASCGIFVQPTGSKATMFLIDNHPGPGGGREARLTGFDYVTGFTASFANPNVTGSNQFPTAAQLAIGNGAVVIRKSSNISATERQWVLFADSSSMYGFIATGDTASYYSSFAFGDIYTLKTGTPDTSKCLIMGKIAERASNGTATIAEDRGDALSLVNAATTGHFMQGSFTRTGGSITVGKHGDGAKGSATVLLGITQYVNGADNGIYLSPVWIHENVNTCIRGRMRGFWHACHATTSFSDGQVLTTTYGDYSAKTFQVVKQSMNGGVYLIETSNTVETN